MKRHWGGFENDSEELKNEKKFNLTQNDVSNLKILRSTMFKIAPPPEIKTLFSRNAAVTQTVELMNQNDVITDTIDTYDPTDPNCLINPNHFLNPSTMARIRLNSRFRKPIWFIPPDDTDFTAGKPKEVPIITKRSVIAALRKSICGLIRTCKFSEVDESALVMLIDSVDHFYSQLIESIVGVLVSENRETETQLSVLDVEKGYMAFSSQSLLSLHNYFNDEIIRKNQNEMNSLLETFEEYDKLVQRQQNLASMYFNDSPVVNLMDNGNSSLDNN